MDVWSVIVALYLTSTVVALFLTYQEQKRRGHKTPVYTVIGYVLCAVWPLVAAVMVIFYRPRKA